MRSRFLVLFLALGPAAFGAAARIPAPTGAAGSAPATPLRIVRHDLSYAVDYDRSRVAGEDRLTIHNPSASPVDRLPLVLYRLFSVKGVADAAGRPAAFSQRVLSFEDWEEYQANFVEVPLAPALPPGGRAEIAVRFGGPLVGNAETGMRYVKDRVDKDFTILRWDCLAYPTIGVSSWQATRSLGLPEFDYRLRVDVPSSLYVANGGRFLGRTEKDGRAVFAYENTKPAWRMDAAIAAYAILEDKDAGSRIYYLPGDMAGAETVALALKETLAILSGWFGPAAGFKGFAVIEVPEGFGSQADVTSILQTRDAFVKAERLPELYHEVAHLWSVPARDPLPSRLESEGIAMFLQYAIQEKREGAAGALDNGAERLRKRFQNDANKNPKLAATPIIDYGRADQTNSAYTKGMLYFYLLDKLAGRDRFLAAWAEFYRRYEAAGATTAEFLAVMGERLGIDLRKLNEDWITGTRSSELLLSAASLDEIAALYRSPR